MNYKILLSGIAAGTIAFAPVKEEVIERNRYIVINEFLNNYYFVRAIEGESMGYIHFESDEKIEENDEITIEKIVSKSLIGFKYEKLDMRINKNKKKLV